VAGKASGLVEDAAIEAAGGGPEDPVADAALAANQQRRASKAAKKSAKAPSSGPAPGRHAKPGPARTPAKPRGAPPKHPTQAARKNAAKAPSGRSVKAPSGPSAPGRAARLLTRTGGQRLLVGEFVACLVILGLGTLLTPPKSTSDGGISRMMVKASGLCGVFLLLGLLSSAGGKSAKAAGALGALITAGYVVSSPDASNIAGWAAAFFAKGGPADNAASGSTKAAVTTGTVTTSPLTAAFPLGHSSDPSGGVAGGTGGTII
jgi:hypothetical protein